jgi:hypothetical protein
LFLLGRDGREQLLGLGSPLLGSSRRAALGGVRQGVDLLERVPSAGMLEKAVGQRSGGLIFSAHED